MDASHKANDTTEQLIRQFRLCHESYWVEKERQEQTESQKQQQSFYLNLDLAIKKQCCQWCAAEDKERSMRRAPKNRRKERRVFVGDELM